MDSYQEERDVMSYEHAPHYGHQQVTLCERCASDLCPRSAELPALGPVSHGWHRGYCSCRCHERGDEMSALRLTEGYWDPRTMRMLCTAILGGERIHCAIVWTRSEPHEEPDLYRVTPEGDEYFAPLALTRAQRARVRAYETRVLNSIRAC